MKYNEEMQQKMDEINLKIAQKTYRHFPGGRHFPVVAFFGVVGFGIVVITAPVCQEFVMIVAIKQR